MTVRSETEGLPPEVRDAADALIAALGDELTALLWHGSEARREQTPESDHDLIVILRRVDDRILRTMREVFEHRGLWSTYVKTEEELRQYPLTGRLQFHYGHLPLYGRIEPPPVTRTGLLEDLRRSAVDIQHECRYRIIHGGRRIDSGQEADFVRVRNARWMYYQAKLAILAMKARELLEDRPYPPTRAALRQHLANSDEIAIVDTVDRWPELRTTYEQDSVSLALLLDRFARALVAKLEMGNGR